MLETWGCWSNENYSLGSESADGGALGHELDGDPGVVGGHEVGVLPCEKITYISRENF